MQDLEQAIRERAYHLWMEEGCQHDKAESHWVAAQREVLASSLSALGSVAKASPKKSLKKPASRKARVA
jgi:Protein of unknown function (DUF2934)